MARLIRRRMTGSSPDDPPFSCFARQGEQAEWFLVRRTVLQAPVGGCHAPSGGVTSPQWRREQMPAGYAVVRTTIAPRLSVRNGVAALEFYKTAFGATEAYRMTSLTASWWRS